MAVDFSTASSSYEWLYMVGTYTEWNACTVQFMGIQHSPVGRFKASFKNHLVSLNVTVSFSKRLSHNKNKLHVQLHGI